MFSSCTAMKKRDVLHMLSCQAILMRNVLDMPCLFACLVCLFVCLFGWLFGCLVVWLVVWLVGWLVVWLFGCLPACLFVGRSIVLITCRRNQQCASSFEFWGGQEHRWCHRDQEVMHEFRLMELFCFCRWCSDFVTKAWQCQSNQISFSL